MLNKIYPHYKRILLLIINIFYKLKSQWMNMIDLSKYKLNISRSIKLAKKPS